MGHKMKRCELTQRGNKMDKQIDAVRAAVDESLGAVEVSEVAALAHINADLFGFL